jgi:protein-tyrosine-phosphatase
MNSAVSDPKWLHQLTVLVMAERGLDLSQARSKGLDEVPADADVVITLCDDAAQRCPAYPGAKRREHWSLPDPAAGPEGEAHIGAFRSIRDDLERRIEQFWRSVRAAGGSPPASAI